MSSTDDSEYSLSDFWKDFPNKVLGASPLESEGLYVFWGLDDELEPLSEKKIKTAQTSHMLSSSPLATERSFMEEANFKVGRYSAEEMRERIHRYRAKRSRRNFKTIKYVCRKTLADNRPRIRGRDDGDDELEPIKTLSNQRPTKAVMKDFLKELELYFFSPVLVQFWMAKSKGGNWVLTTSDQPFGVNDIFHKGLASYRSHCVNNNYVISDNEEADDIGPQVRVFRDKCLEWSTNVGYYSVKDYPQRQYTISYGVRGLLALPVFRDMGGPCIGVLEIVTTSCGAIECDDVLNVCKRLEAAGLVCPNTYCSPLVDMFEGTKDAFKEISKALDKVCKTLQIPFAQTWVPCPHSLGWASGSSERKSYTSFDGGDSGHVKLTTDGAPYSMAACNLNLFRETIQLYQIRKGKGVVGRAFSSHNACFCDDITKLSIIEYPLAHHAYVDKLTSSFAIALRSSYTGNIVYILEFFLSPVKIDGEDPPIFLHSLLGTMKQHFHSFRVASGEELGGKLSIEVIKELGGKLSIEVIKLSMEDELNSFEICQTTRSPPWLEALRDGEETMQLDSPYQQLMVEVATNIGRNVVGAEQRNSTSYLPMLEACQNGGEIVQPDSSYHKAMAEVDTTNSGRNVVSAEQRDSSYRKSMSEVDATNCGRNVVSAEHRAISCLPAVLALQNGGQMVQLDSSYQKNMAEVDATNNEKKFASADQSDIADIPLEKRGPAEGSDREGEISREDLEKLFGTNIENAARILGVSRSTFKRKCRQCGIKPWPFPKRNRVTRSPSQLESIRGGNKQTGESGRRDCLPCDKAPKQATTSSASTMPHASAKQNESSVTIKATYGDDIIKFQLSFSSGMVELQEKVAKTLNLKAASFKIKYADEDDDWILLPGDEALQDCINSWRSSDRTTIKMLVLPIP